MNKKRLARLRARWLLAQLAPARPLQIADIGARQMKRPPAYQPLLDMEAAELTGFEPDPDAFEVLQKDAPAHARYINKAVGKPGPATFYAHHVGSLSSIYRLSAKAAAYLGKGFWVKRPIEEMDMTLVSLDKVDGMPKLDLLKMDIQGAEFDVLKGGKKTLANAVMIIPEIRFYQMYEEEPMWADIDILLRKIGFVLHCFAHQKKVRLPSGVAKRLNASMRSQLLDGDAVYIRNLETAEDVTDDQVKILALLADCVTKSYDLTLHCLDILVQRDVLPDTVLEGYLARLPSDLMVDPSDGVQPA
ncbi:FkbM family methyltransferase [Pseudooctadecabacter sp.]|uniref:FkbM family methyltransferase n=1 Tax=Pseudooctadecabacter sp. TaxID=1966338 RepID=UPI0035C7A276